MLFWAATCLYPLFPGLFIIYAWLERFRRISYHIFGLPLSALLSLTMLDNMEFLEKHKAFQTEELPQLHSFNRFSERTHPQNHLNYKIYSQLGFRNIFSCPPRTPSATSSSVCAYRQSFITVAVGANPHRLISGSFGPWVGANALS